MKYQLVIQFPAESQNDFDNLIEIENELIKKLTGDSEVDGHDFGSGEMNIFIFTNEPNKTFSHVITMLTSRDENISNMKAGYRVIEDEDFTVLWPNDLTEFVVR